VARRRRRPMKAMLMRRWGEPSQLEYTELERPVAASGEVRIDVRAIGCNLPDILMVQGRYQRKPPLPFVPGWEAAGVVDSVGSGVEGFAPGDRVFALPGLGAYAESVCAPAAHVYHLPQELGFEQGASFGLVYLTSYAALVHRAQLRPGETLLVHGAAGGVGLAAVQIAKALGARVIACASSPEKREVARRAGADVTLDPGGDWAEAVKAETHGAWADVIFDPVGGEAFDGSTKCIAFEGRLLVVGFAGGRIGEVAANRVLLKNIAVVGVHLALYRQRNPALVRKWMAELLAMAAAGKLEPVVFKTFPLHEAAHALGVLASRASYGKVVLIP